MAVKKKTTVTMIRMRRDPSVVVEKPLIVPVMMYADERERVKELAAKLGDSVSGVVRRLLEEEYERVMPRKAKRKS